MTDITAAPETRPGNDNFTKAAQILARLQSEIARAVVGQQEAIELTLIALVAGGHVLVEGVPGLGKTLLVRALAKTFGGGFARIQFTPDLMPSDVTGHALYELKSQEFKIRKGPVFTHLLLADEINRAPAKTQAALLEVMQENQVTIEGQSFPLPRPFMVLATQNPIEQEGTYPLPEAQLDRFLLKIVVDYPGEREEQALLSLVTQGRIGDVLEVDSLATLVSTETMQGMQRLAAAVRIEDRVRDYAVAIVRATRQWPGVAIGAGPRGGIALLRAARVAALMAERDFVTPDDVKRLVLPALRHRLVLSPELEMEGLGSAEVLRQILESVQAPRL
ncbi:MAG: family ATPase [Moraxellaceae bacterium]|jgi:MoxR-like ATPase|nr:family ATPase [Moraxellaceae bacterium]